MIVIVLQILAVGLAAYIGAAYGAGIAFKYLVGRLPQQSSSMPRKSSKTMLDKKP